jgi:hypothetical protein
MNFEIQTFRDYLDKLLEAHPGCADYKIKIVMPAEISFGLFVPKLIDIAHDSGAPDTQPYLALVLEDYSVIKKFMDNFSIVAESKGNH